MADKIAPFAFTTQEDWYGELTFRSAEDGSALSLAGRQFVMLVTPATSGAQITEPAIELKMGQDGGLSFKQGDPSTLVFRAQRTKTKDLRRGEYTADILEVVGGERYLFMPVRISYAEPSALGSFISRFLGANVSFASRVQPIVTPVAVAGRQGARGNSILNGTRAPTAADGVDGDFWINTASDPRLIYGPKANGAWPANGVEISVRLSEEMIAARDAAQAAATLSDARSNTAKAEADRAATAATSAAQVAPNRTYETLLSELAGNPALAVGTVRQVSTDPNSGTYELRLVNGAKTWVRTGATVPALDALTAFVRQALVPNDDGSFSIRDPDGNIFFRLDGSALTLANLVLKGSLSLDSIGDTSFSTYSDAEVAFAIKDRKGYILLALMRDGTLIVPKLQIGDTGPAGDYSADYIEGRSNAALSQSAIYGEVAPTTVAAAVWAYSLILLYGQSLEAGQEAWPAKTLQGMIDVLMLGLSTRPGGANTATAPTPLGDSVLRPAVATVQVQNTGALLDAAAQAALPAGNDALGEDPGVAGMQFARKMMLQRFGLATDPSRRIVVTNVAVSGRSIEELSKGASPEYFNRLREMAKNVKNTLGAGVSIGIPALLFDQGQWNYNGTNGGSTDKETYKSTKLKLYNDFCSDVCVGIFGQTEKPALIYRQTGAAYTVDTTDMSIGMAQWEMSDGNPITGGHPNFFLSGPTYPYTDKGGHLDANGSRLAGLKDGQVYDHVVTRRRRWRPLSPTRITVRRRTALIDFHLPVGGRLQFQPCYRNGSTSLFPDKGFTVIDSLGVIPIVDVSIPAAAVVQIILSRDPIGLVYVYYARQTVFNGNGNLCDDDQTVSPFNYEYSAGSGDYATANLTDPKMPLFNGRPYPLWNWCIAFKMLAVAN